MDDFQQDRQEAAHSPVSEKTSSLLSRHISLRPVLRGLWNIAGALYTRKYLIGLIGAILVVIGAVMLWMADQLMFNELSQTLSRLYSGNTSALAREWIAEQMAHAAISPLTWLLALAGIAAGILVFRAQSGKFLMITGMAVAAYALFTYWGLSDSFSPSSAQNSWDSWGHWGILTTLIGGCLLWHAGSAMYKFNWWQYIAKHLSWKGFLGFGRNARIRVYCYLAVLLFFAFDCSIGNVSLLVREALSSLIDYSALPKEAYFQKNAAGHLQAISIKNNIIDVFACNHDLHSSGDHEKLLLAKTGLTKVQLQRLSDRRALRPLVTAALKLHCLPRAVTTIVKDPYTKSPAAICKELWRADAKHAQEIYQQEVGQFWRDVNPSFTIKYARPADYLQPALWKEGWNRFIGAGKDLIRETEELVPNPLLHAWK